MSITLTIKLLNMKLQFHASHKSPPQKIKVPPSKLYPPIIHPTDLLDDLHHQENHR